MDEFLTFWNEKFSSYVMKFVVVIVHHASLSNNFNAPSINTFDVANGPQDHLDIYNNIMRLYKVFEMAKCHYLAVTLIREPINGLKDYQLVP